jgi:hypothetical protein
LLVYNDKDKNGNVRKIKLIPELVSICGLTDRETADPGLMRELAKETKLEPAERMRYSEAHAKKLQQAADRKIEGGKGVI